MILCEASTKYPVVEGACAPPFPQIMLFLMVTVEFCAPKSTKRIEPPVLPEKAELIISMLEIPVPVTMDANAPDVGE